MTNIKSYLALFVCYSIWGTQPIFWALLGDFNSVFVLCCRILMGMLTLYAYLLATGRFSEMKATFKDKATMKSLIPAALFIGLDWGIFVFASARGYIVDASIGYFVNPLIIFMCSAVFFKERGHILEYVGVLVAFLGVILSTIQLGTFPINSIPFMIMWPAYACFTKMANADPIISMAVETTILAPFAIIYLVLFGFGDGGVSLISSSTIIPILLTGIVTVFPMVLYTYVVNDLPFMVVGVGQYVGSIITLVCGVLFLHEELTSSKIVMFCCIWLGLIIYTVGTIKKDKLEKQKLVNN